MALWLRHLPTKALPCPFRADASATIFLALVFSAENFESCETATIIATVTATLEIFDLESLNPTALASRHHSFSLFLA